MAQENLTYNPGHNVCVWLEVDTHKEKESKFAPIVAYIKNSDLHYAVTRNVEISERIIREFWTTARVLKDKNQITIFANIDGHEVKITESVIRRILHLNDEGGIDTFETSYLFSWYKRLGYQGDYNRKSIKKTRLYCTWRFLLHMGIQCIGSRKGGFDEASLPLASGVLAFIQGKRFNWSNLILNGMRYNLEEAGPKHKHLLYPRFIQLIIDDILSGIDLNRGINKIRLRHMQKSIFNFCQAQPSKSTFVNIEVPLFGPIIGEPFVEDFQVSNDVENVGNVIKYQSDQTATHQNAVEVNQTDEENQLPPITVEPIMEDIFNEENQHHELVNQTHEHNVDNIHHESMNEQTSTLEPNVTCLEVDEDNYTVRLEEESGRYHDSRNDIENEEVCTDFYQILMEEQSERFEIEQLNETTNTTDNIILGKRDRDGSTDVDETSDEDEQSQLKRIEKGKSIAFQSPKRKRVDLDMNVFAERQKKGVELQRDSTQNVTKSSNDLVDLKSMVKTMDVTIKEQQSKIESQDKIIDELRDMIIILNARFDSFLQSIPQTNQKAFDENEQNHNDGEDGEVGDNVNVSNDNLQKGDNHEQTAIDGMQKILPKVHPNVSTKNQLKEKDTEYVEVQSCEAVENLKQSVDSEKLKDAVVNKVCSAKLPFVETTMRQDSNSEQTGVQANCLARIVHDDEQFTLTDFDKIPAVLEIDVDEWVGDDNAGSQKKKKVSKHLKKRKTNSKKKEITQTFNKEESVVDLQLEQRRKTLRRYFLEEAAWKIFSKEIIELDPIKVWGLETQKKSYHTQFLHFMKTKQQPFHTVHSKVKLMSIKEVYCLRLSRYVYPVFHVVRLDRKEYVFSEADFSWLDIEDIEFIFDYLTTLQDKTTDIQIALKAVRRNMRAALKLASLEDFQIGIETLQPKINLTIPNQELEDIDELPIGLILEQPEFGIVFRNSELKKIFVRFDEVPKYSDGTLWLMQKVLYKKLGQVNKKNPESIETELINKALSVIEDRLGSRNVIRRFERCYGEHAKNFFKFPPPSR